MSALTNDPFKLARFAGMYNAVQSAGAAGSFGMDAALTPLLNEQLASWALLLVSFPLAFLVLRTVKETNYEDQSVSYVDDGDESEDGTRKDAGKQGVEVVSVLSDSIQA